MLLLRGTEPIGTAAAKISEAMPQCSANYSEGRRSNKARTWSSSAVAEASGPDAEFCSSSSRCTFSELWCANALGHRFLSSKKGTKSSRRKKKGRKGHAASTEHMHAGGGSTNLPSIANDMEETSWSSGEDSSRARSPSPFLGRRRPEVSSSPRSRIHSSPRLLVSCSSQVGGRAVDNGTAVDEESLRSPPRKEPEKVKTRITTRCLRSIGTQWDQPVRVTEEETRRLLTRSPVRHVSSASYESALSSRERTHPDPRGTAYDKSQSLGAIEYELDEQRCRPFFAKAAALSDLTVSFTVVEQQDSSDASQLLTGLRQKRSTPEHCSLPRAFQRGSVSTTHVRKGEFQDSTSSVSARQLDLACFVDRSNESAPLSQPEKLDRKGAGSHLPVPDPVNVDFPRLTSDDVSTSLSKDRAGNLECISTAESDTSELSMANAMEVLPISRSGHIMSGRALASWIERQYDIYLPTPSNSDMAGSAGSGPNSAIISDDSALVTLSFNSAATSDEIDMNAVNSEDNLVTPAGSPIKSNTSKTAPLTRDCAHASDTRSQTNQAFGDYSYGHSKSHKSLQAPLRRISRGFGECGLEPAAIKTYVYHGHDMRKGGFRKKAGRAELTQCGATTEVRQKTSASFSFDILSRCTRGTKGAEPLLLGSSFPCPTASKKKGGKHLLQVLKATGASGSCPPPKIGNTSHPLSPSQHYQRSPSHEIMCAMNSPGTTAKKSHSTTPLEETPTVEPQQPFRRIILKRKLLLYPSIALLGMALFFSATSPFFWSSKPTKHFGNYSHPTSRVSPTDRKDTTIYQDVSREDYDTCSTIPCKRDGTYLKGLISWHLDPCDNFYRFICGRWKSVASATSTEPKLDVPATMWNDRSHHLEHSVHLLLQRSSTAEDLTPLKGLFYECMNTRQLDIDDWTPMLELLWLVSLEGFPFSSSPRNSTSIWKVAAKVLKMTGAEPLLSVATSAHPSKADVSIISVSLPDMLAPKGSAQLQATELYNSTAFICMTALKKQRNPSIYSLEVASLASRLEELVYTHTVMAGLPQRRIQPLKTQPELSSFLFEIFLNSDSALYSGSHTEVMVRSPSFLDALISLVHSTEPYVLMNYLGVRLMIAVAPFTPSSGRLLVQTTVKHQYGRARPSLPRWKLCIRAVERAIPDLFLHAIRLAYRTQFAMDPVQRLLRSVRHSLAGNLAKLAVLDRETSPRALALLNATRFRLFRPSWLTNKEKLERYVSALPRVVRGQSLRSFHTLHSHSLAERLRRDESDRWQGSAFDHDCSYDGKVVFVPVLLFNFSAFNRDADPSLELPHAGVRLAHCLLQLLLAGVSRGETAPPGGPWWPDMTSSFLAVSQLCFQQYGLPHVGSLELLQYTAAIKPAMDLYQEDKRIDVRFETFQAYTATHLFFAYYALSFCQESRSDNVTEVASYLTNTPLWNNRVFQETFRCPVGSNMNPFRKCVVWREAH